MSYVFIVLMIPEIMSFSLRGDVDLIGDLDLTDITAIRYYMANIETPYSIGTKI